MSARRATAVLASCVMLAASPASSAAQDIDTIPVPLVEVSAGYALMRDTSNSYPGGWYFSAATNLNRWFGLVAEASGSHRSHDETWGLPTFGTVTLSEKAQVYTFMVGPRFFHKAGRVVPFGQILAGVAHQRLQLTETRTDTGPNSGVYTWSPSSTLLALQPGGGITLYLSERVGVRVAGDYRAVIYVDEEAVANEFRFLTGLTFHWGSR